jgi:PAS domain S-box-containing protein
VKVGSLQKTLNGKSQFKDQELKTTIEITLNKFLTEQKLKQNQHCLGTILKTIGDGVIASDREGKIAFMNPIAETLTGWKERDACGQQATEVFKLKYPETQALSEHPIQKVLQEGITVGLPARSQPIDRKLIDKNGLEIPIDDCIAPIKDDRGNIMGAVLVFRDMSEHQRVEAMHQKQIEQERLLVQMEKLHELKDDFLSTVSHELRTPIANMKMAIQMLQTSSNQARRQRYLEILQAECNREAELITELLDLQRLEKSSYPTLVQEAIDLKEWLPKIVAPFSIRAQENNQLLQIQLAPNLSQMLTDRASLERAIAELTNNACKYTPAGGVIAIDVQCRQTREQREKKAEAQREKLSIPQTPHPTTPVDLTEETSATHWIPYTPTTNYQLPTTYTVFTIRNQAEIPATELPKIFDKFYRVPNSDRWKQGGTGLGLALVQKLVEHLQGTIQVESKGGWTTFTVELPNRRVMSE